MTTESSSPSSSPELKGTARIIARTPEPRTRLSLAADLRALGVQPGMVLFVHSSLSALGWVNGDEVAVIQALIDALGDAGTLVMPSFAGACTDPANWRNPPVPPAWVQTIRDTMPTFDPAYTPTWKLGRIAELFRIWPGVQRSLHPYTSFAARGPQAEYITANHKLDYSLGEGSPLARMYELDAYVLMLGTDYGTNTSFHLSEYRAPGAKPFQEGTVILDANGQRQWVTVQEIELDEDIFPEIGAEFDQTGQVVRGMVGSAETRLYRQRAGVDFATAWLTAKRGS